MTQQLAIPTQVKVGMYDYSVDETPDLTAPDGTGLWGEAQYVSQTIKLDSALQSTPLRRLNVFMHELTHAMLYEAGIHEYFNDETAVSAFSNMLTQVFVENGWRFGAEGSKTAQECGPTPVDDIYEHNGVKYRKVARRPVAGDLLLVIANDPAGCYLVGDVLAAVHDGIFRDSAGDRRSHGALNDVVVLVPLEGGDSHAESPQ
jgi:hypothetical protein